MKSPETIARIKASNPDPSVGDRIIHCSDDARGTIVRIARDVKHAIAAVAWDDGEHDTYEVSALQYLKRTGEWITFG